MHVINVSYNDPDRWRQVLAISGPRLSLLASLRSGGTGSPAARLLRTTHTELNALLEPGTADIKVNLERTTDGAILYFRALLETWAIPLRRGEAAVGLQDGEVTLILADATISLDVPSGKGEKLEAWLRNAL